MSAFCSIIAGGVAFGIWATGPVLFARIFRKVYIDRCMAKTRFLFFCLAGISGGVLAKVVGGAGFPSTGVIEGVIVSLITFSCLFVLYMPFVFVVYTSLSVETILILATRDDKFAESSELNDKFASEAFVIKRLERMVESGVLECRSDGKFTASPKGHKLALFFGVIKSFLHLSPGG